jgi:hypothetical protein
VSSNLVFSQWDQISKDAMTTMAAIDRLVHQNPSPPGAGQRSDGFRCGGRESKFLQSPKP